MQGPTLNMKKKLKYVVVVAFVLAFAVLVGSLVNISIVNYDFYSDYAKNLQLHPQTIPANRGSIYDRNMSVIAQSATVYDVVISPKDIAAKFKLAEQKGDLEIRRQEISKGLSEILETDYEKIMELTQKTKSQYEIIKKKVEKEVADKVLALMDEKDWTNEINLIESTKRFYTNPTRASTLIGFTGSDSQGLYGLEYQYDKELSGTPGYIVSLKNGRSENIPMSYEEKHEPTDGNSLVLTIDETIQRFLDKALTQVMAEHKPKMGCAGIVMNVNTGEILAMDSMPTFDLNQPFYIQDEEKRTAIEAMEAGDAKNNAKSAAQQAQWINKAIAYDYEPGSTFKTITTSAALEEKTTSLDTSFFCQGEIKVEDRTMGCHVGKPGHGKENFTDALVNSCNPAFVNIGFALGGQQFFRYFQSFGLTEKTGIDLPGEGQGAYISENLLKSSKVSLASCSFGQSTTVTAIQMITAVSAAVNGGYLVTPHVVKDVLDQNGNIVRSVTTDVKRQVISKETSNTLRQMMEAVVETKKGSNAYVPGYRIGGKSGTSQKQKASDDKEDRISSYVAVAPIDKPEIAVYIMVDIPTSGDSYGSVVAAPPAQSVMADTLPYLGFSPSFTAEEIAKQDLNVPFLIGEGVLKATGVLSIAGHPKPTVIGEGATVVKQVPSAGSKIAKDGKIILYTDETTVEKLIKMPNVVGMQPVEAKNTLVALGFNVVIKGESLEHKNSKITGQSIEEGAEMVVGTVVELTSVTSESD